MKKTIGDEGNVVNINDKVKAELTHYGHHILYQFCQSSRVPLSSYLTANNTFESELWALMNIFGGRMYSGSKQIFQDNEFRCGEDKKSTELEQAISTEINGESPLFTSWRGKMTNLTAEFILQADIGIKGIYYAIEGLKMLSLETKERTGTKLNVNHELRGIRNRLNELIQLTEEEEGT